MTRALACLLALAACVTPAPEGPLTLISVPSGASVRLSDGRDCRTPCAVELAAPLTATVAKAGHRARTLTLAPGQRGTVTVTLPPAGRAVDVEEVDLELEPAG